MPSPSALPDPEPGPAPRLRTLPSSSSGPPGLAAALDPEDARLYRTLRRDWHARIRPRDEAERAAADAAVGRIWRRWRLEAVEEQVLRALGRGVVVPGLPSLAQLVRYRARLAADYALLADELAELRDSRPALPERSDLSPERLEWLAARLRERGADPGRADPRGERRAERAGAPVHAAPEPPRPTGWALRWPPEDRVRRHDWLAASSRYALEAGLMAQGRSPDALKDPRTGPS